ncbi:MAG: hypothetical protein J5819_05190, partial [Eubacterium sp.]|nr:hypothetical protein [Eubacterium sp.]
FFAIHPVELNYKSMAEPLDPKRRLFRGKLIPTEKCELPKGLTESPLLEQEVKTVRYYRYGNILLVWAIDQQVGEIILVKQEDPSVCYHIDYVHITDDLKLTQPIKNLRDNAYFRLMPLEPLPLGTYDIYIKFKKKYYRTDKVVGISK